MALSAPTLVTPSIGNPGSTATTANFTPTAGALLLTRAGVNHGNVPGLPTITDTAGLTWVPLANDIYDAGVGTRHIARVWGAIVPATPPLMAVAIASSPSTRTVISVAQVIGHGGIPGNSAANNSDVGDPTVTLGSAPAASSLVIAFLSANGTDSVFTPPAGFTSIGSGNANALLSWNTCYDLASAPTTIALSSTWGASVGIAIEVTEAGGGGIRLRRIGARMQHLLVR